MSVTNMDAQESRQPAAPEVVYTPDRFRRLGWRIWALMFRDISDARGLVWRLFLRNWTAQYRQSWLGYMWAFVPPVTAVAAFSFLARHRILPIGETPVPYVAYALWGVTMWQLFTGSCNAVSQSLAGAGIMVSRVNFAKDTLAFSAVGRPLFDFLVRGAAVAVVFAALGIAPAWTAVTLPIALLPLLLMAVGTGMVVAVVSVTGTDFDQIVSMALSFGMFLTPVIYPPPASWPFALVNVLNPVSPVIIAGHDLLERGTLTMPGPYAMSWLFSVLVFGIGWRFFYIAMPRVAERF